MSRFAKPAHLAGLAASIGLTALIALYWPWPFALIRAVSPDFFRQAVLPVLRDYQEFIGFLAAICILSLANRAWVSAAARIVRKGKKK